MHTHWLSESSCSYAHYQPWDYGSLNFCPSDGPKHHLVVSSTCGYTCVHVGLFRGSLLGPLDCYFFTILMTRKYSLFPLPIFYWVSYLFYFFAYSEYKSYQPYVLFLWQTTSSQITTSFMGSGHTEIFNFDIVKFISFSLHWSMHALYVTWEIFSHLKVTAFSRMYNDEKTACWVSGAD